jgi:hypothetical protein
MSICSVWGMRPSGWSWLACRSSVTLSWVCNFFDSLAYCDSLKRGGIHEETVNLQSNGCLLDTVQAMLMYMQHFTYWATVTCLNQFICWTRVTYMQHFTYWATVTCLNQFICWTRVTYMQRFTYWATVTCLNQFICWTRVTYMQHFTYFAKVKYTKQFSYGATTAITYWATLKPSETVHLLSDPYLHETVSCWAKLTYVRFLKAFIFHDAFERFLSFLSATLRKGMSRSHIRSTVHVFWFA